MTELISGALVALSLVAGLFFLRFWKKTRDRFFAFFAAAFWLLALNRLAVVLLTETSEHLAAAYLPRLVAFVLILVAIVDKNRVRKPRA
jgi:uncharacterized membrane protein